MKFWITFVFVAALGAASGTGVWLFVHAVFGPIANATMACDAKGGSLAIDAKGFLVCEVKAK